MVKYYFTESHEEEYCRLALPRIAKINKRSLDKAQKQAKHVKLFFRHVNKPVAGWWIIVDY